MAQMPPFTAEENEAQGMEGTQPEGDGTGTETQELGSRVCICLGESVSV